MGRRGGRIGSAGHCNAVHAHEWQLADDEPSNRRTMYLRLSFYWREEYAEMWTHFREEFEQEVLNSSVIAQVADASAQQATTHQTATQQATAQAARPQPSGAVQTNGQTNGNDQRPDRKKGKAGGKGAGQKTPSQKVWSEGLRMKKLVKDATNEAIQIMEQIQAKSPKWQWADNDENRGVLQRQIEVVKDALGSFGRKWMDHNGASINTMFPASVIETELVKFVNTRRPWRISRK